MCSRSTRTALGWMRGLGRLPALATSTWPPARWRSRASAIGERALLPVQTNSTLRPRAAVSTVGRRGGVRSEAQRRVQRRPAGGQRVRAALQVQVVVAVAAVEAAAVGGDQPAAAQQPQVVGDQVLRLDRPASTSSRTRQSLAASSLSSRHRSGWAASRTKAGVP